MMWFEENATAREFWFRRLFSTLMRQIMRFLNGLFVVVICGCTGYDTSQITFQACSDEWVKFVEDQIPTGDDHGHGPDPGSSEWQSTIEFKLGIRGNDNVPAIDSPLRCNYINEQIVKQNS